jgi:diphthamide synthase subunit DPH2
MADGANKSLQEEFDKIKAKLLEGLKHKKRVSLQLPDELKMF